MTSTPEPTADGGASENIGRRFARLRGAWWVGIVAVAAYLRVWHLGSQIPFDDEWHALAYIVQHDLGFLLTHYTRLGANSVPNNVYLRLAHDTVGLSEWSIVLPSLLAGIALPAVFARWLAARLGLAAGVVGGLLLAFSPFLIFYSRFARPYAPLLLLELLAVVQLTEWTRVGGRRRAVAAVLCAALAIWTHLTAVPPLACAWLACLVWQWRQPERAHVRAPGPVGVLLAGAATTALAALLDLPALVSPSNPAAEASAAFSLHTLETVTQLLCGTGYLGLRLLVGVAALAGVVIAARRLPRELVVVGAATLGAVVSVLVGHPLQSEVGAIFARYCLSLFLLLPLLVGAAAAWLVERLESARLRRWGGALGLGVLGAALYFAGPLPFVFTDHASFTKHPAFQYEYHEPTGERTLPDPVGSNALPLGRGQLHPVYAELAKGGSSAPIIEYPFVIGQDYNRLYFAQMLHGRPVLAGYYASGAGWFDRFGLALGQAHGDLPPRQNRGFLVSDMTIDHALGPLPDRSHIKFRTVVDLGDGQAIRKSGAAFVILHWNMARELLRMEVDSSLGKARSRFVAALRDRLQSELGPPRFEDSVLTVFAVP